MSTVFHVIDKQRGIIRCHYCNHEQDIRKVKLV
jgi:aspartate carbamoyltransferase regulatory subunit